MLASGHENEHHFRNKFQHVTTDITSAITNWLVRTATTGSINNVPGGLSQTPTHVRGFFP